MGDLAGHGADGGEFLGLADLAFQGVDAVLAGLDLSVQGLSALDWAVQNGLRIGGLVFDGTGSWLCRGSML